MITIERLVSLDEMLRVERLDGVAFTSDSEGHKFVIAGMRDGVQEPFTGTVGGQFVKPDGGKVALSNTVIEDGRAWVVIPASCYSDTGHFSMIITHTADGNKTVIYSCAGYMATM